MIHSSLASELMSKAVCHTDHPAEAASALLLAAGELLYVKFGVDGAIGMLRSIIDDTEDAMHAVHHEGLRETVR